jgi:hypothetical protein
LINYDCLLEILSGDTATAEPTPQYGVIRAVK